MLTEVVLAPITYCSSRRRDWSPSPVGPVWEPGAFPAKAGSPAARLRRVRSRRCRPEGQEFREFEPEGKGGSGQQNDTGDEREYQVASPSVIHRQASGPATMPYFVSSNGSERIARWPSPCCAATLRYPVPIRALYSHSTAERSGRPYGYCYYLDEPVISTFNFSPTALRVSFK